MKTWRKKPKIVYDSLKYVKSWKTLNEVVRRKDTIQPQDTIRGVPQPKTENHT